MGFCRNPAAIPVCIPSGRCTLELFVRWLYLRSACSSKNLIIHVVFLVFVVVWFACMWHGARATLRGLCAVLLARILSLLFFLFFFFFFFLHFVGFLLLLLFFLLWCVTAVLVLVLLWLLKLRLAARTAPAVPSWATYGMAGVSTPPSTLYLCVSACEYRRQNLCMARWLRGLAQAWGHSWLKQQH